MTMHLAQGQPLERCRCTWSSCLLACAWGSGSLHHRAPLHMQPRAHMRRHNVDTAASVPAPSLDQQPLPIAAPSSPAHNLMSHLLHLEHLPNPSHVRLPTCPLKPADQPARRPAAHASCPPSSQPLPPLPPLPTTPPSHPNTRGHSDTLATVEMCCRPFSPLVRRVHLSKPLRPTRPGRQESFTCLPMSSASMCVHRLITSHPALGQPSNM